MSPEPQDSCLGSVVALYGCMETCGDRRYKEMAYVWNTPTTC